MIYRGGCHCGAVRFEVEAPGRLTVLDCNCSLCAMTGFLHLIVPKSRFRLLQGEGDLATYRFNTGVAEHHFCVACGIYTHHRRRSNPDELGVNVACLDGLSPFDFAEVPVNEGRLHPNDADPATYKPIAGWLRFEPAQ